VSSRGGAPEINCRPDLQAGIRRRVDRGLIFARTSTTFLVKVHIYSDHQRLKLFVRFYI
jgi:hypothetical protein